jgi:hypothetical protein
VLTRKAKARKKEFDQVHEGDGGLAFENRGPILSARCRDSVRLKERSRSPKEKNVPEAASLERAPDERDR